MRVLAAVPLLLLLPACPSVREYPGGNGEEGIFHLQSRLTEGCADDTALQPAPSPPPCASERCWMLALEPGPLQVEVVRRVRIADCNGIGDCSRDVEFRAFGDVAAAEVTVEPQDAATVERLTQCDGAMRVTMSVHRPGDFALNVRLGDDADTFPLRAVDDCETDAFDCEAFVHAPPDAPLPPTCCGLASNPPR